MAITLVHEKVTSKADGVDPTLVQPSDWNAEHTLTCGPNVILGNNTTGTGAVVELSPTDVQTMLGTDGAMIGTNNLSEIASKATSRTNLGIFVQSGDPAASAADGDLWIW